MARFQVPAQITKIETMSDRGTRLVIHTAEISPDEMTVLFAQRNQAGWMAFDLEPLSPDALQSSESAPKLKDGKSQSQLLRACLYRLWEARVAISHEVLSFDDFYMTRMGTILGSVKKELMEYDR